MENQCLLTCFATVPSVARTMPLISLRSPCLCCCSALMRWKELTFVYLILLSYQRNLLSPLGSKERWLTRKPTLCLCESNASIKSFEFYINIGFVRIATVFLQTTMSSMLVGGLWEKSLVHFCGGHHFCVFLGHPGSPVGSASEQKNDAWGPLWVLGPRVSVPSSSLLRLILAMLVAAYFWLGYIYS